MYKMSTRLPSDDQDVDVSALQREVGADSVASTQMLGIQTRQQRREAETTAQHRPNTQSGTAAARVQNSYFEPLISGRQCDEEYDESEYASKLANIWQPTAAHHVNARSAANPSMIDADTLARAFTHYVSMSGHGVSRNVPEKKAFAVAKFDKPKWDTPERVFSHVYAPRHDMGKVAQD